MKRFKIAIILSIMLTVGVSFVSVAADVGAIIGAGDLSVTGTYLIDPRTDAKYSSNFDAPTEFEYKNYGDVVVKYTARAADGTEVTAFNFFRIWTEQEYCGIYLNSQNSLGGYNIANSLILPNKKYAVTCAFDNFDGSYAVSTIKPFKVSNSYNEPGVVGNNKGYTSYNVEVVESDFPVFSSRDDLLYYLNSGIVQNALYDSTTHYSGDDLYFKDFRVIPHISNDFDKSYFDIYYELSDFSLANIDTLLLRIDNSYVFDYRNVTNADGNYSFEDYTTYISLKGKQKGFKLYLNDILSMHEATLEGNIPKVSVLGIQSGLPSEISTIVGSNLYMQFYLRCNTSEGFKQSKRNDYNYDFLNNGSDYSIWVPEADTSPNGNFSYAQEGDSVVSNDYYYYDSTENKYYYTHNGSTTEITKNEYDNSSQVINPGGGSGGGGSSSSSSGGASANASVGNITINVNQDDPNDDIVIKDDDMNSKGLISALSHGFGFIDNTDTGAKGDGIVALTNDFYGFLPGDFGKLIMFGLGTVIGVAIIRMFTRR